MYKFTNYTPTKTEQKARYLVAVYIGHETYPVVKENHNNRHEAETAINFYRHLFSTMRRARLIDTWGEEPSMTISGKEVRS